MKNRRKQRQSRTHALAWMLLFALLAAGFAAWAGVVGMLRLVDGWTQDVPDLQSTDAFSYAQESVMYAADGTTLLARFQLEKRDPVTRDQISDYVVWGTVDTEDIRFYEHNGADLVGIARAVVNNLTGGAIEGGSTITQQLVRNTILSQEANDITFERKAREIELAVEMEKTYSKDEILQMYLNTINYGDGCYGIQAAAQNYFQVSALDLTLAQAAALVGIPQSPEYLNPKTHPEDCLERRNLVLDRMLQAGHISQEEHDAAAAEPLGLNPAPDAPADGIYAYPYFTSYVRDELLRDDNPYGCSYADLFEGGLTIYTTLDPALQAEAEAARDAQLARMAPELDAALVAIDPGNGHVRAMVGGKDYTAAESGQVNLATGSGGSGRQAGSSFKAFTLAAAIKAGIDPATLIDCTSPMTVGAENTRIENFGNANYGIRSIQRATAVSSNTGYVRLIQELGPQTVADLAHEMGITSDLDAVPTLTLGSSAVTPLEMASAYARLGRGAPRRRRGDAHRQLRRRDGLRSPRHLRPRPGRARRGSRHAGAAHGVREQRGHRVRIRPLERTARGGQDRHVGQFRRPLAGGIQPDPVVRDMDRQPRRKHLHGVVAQLQRVLAGFHEPRARRHAGAALPLHGEAGLPKRFQPAPKSPLRHRAAAGGARGRGRARLRRSLHRAERRGPDARAGGANARGIRGGLPRGVL